MKLAKALKEYRNEHKITQVEMARLLGVTVATLSRWENEHKEPRHRLFKEKLEEVLGEGIEELKLREGEVRKFIGVRLTESVREKEDPLAGLYWKATILANKYPDRVCVETTGRENVIKLKIKTG